MSKKRILSDGYSSYWKNDVKVYKKEDKILTDEFKQLQQEKFYMILTGVKGMKTFNKMIEEYIRNEQKNTRIFKNCS